MITTVFIILAGLWILLAEWRIARLERAAKHHEHVLRLHLPEKGFPRMVLDEGAWDPRDRLGSRVADNMCPTEKS